MSGEEKKTPKSPSEELESEQKEEEDEEEEGAANHEIGPEGADGGGGGGDPEQPSAALRQKQWLPEDFRPHRNDVLCGRGKTYREWPGNERFRLVVLAHLDEYKVAIGRAEKGEILTRVVESVRSHDGATGFLKQGACPRFIR
jgi:hypothetical protein